MAAGTTVPLQEAQSTTAPDSAPGAAPTPAPTPAPAAAAGGASGGNLQAAGIGAAASLIGGLLSQKAERKRAKEAAAHKRQALGLEIQAKANQQLAKGQQKALQSLVAAFGKALV